MATRQEDEFRFKSYDMQLFDHEKRLRFLERLVNGMIGAAGLVSLVLRYFGH